MCPRDAVVLRITNRGCGVTQTHTHTSFAVDLPATLRGRGGCSIEVVYAFMQIDYDFVSLGIDSNISPIGYNTETPINSQSFNGSSLHRLVTISIENHTLGIPVTFRCGALPERIEFTRVGLRRADLDGIVGPVEFEDGYIEIIMNISFDE
jgi:hypothetical protein